MKWWALAIVACGCSSTSKYESAVLDDHPAAYWPLDDDPGSRFALDHGDHGHDAVNVGGVAFGSAGAFAGSKSAHFDQNQWLAAGDQFGFDNNESFTLEVWLDPDMVDTWRPVLVKGDYFSGTDGYWLMTNQNVLIASSQSATVQSGVSVPLTAGQWTYVAVVFDGLGVDFYLDGVLAEHGELQSRWDPSPVPFSIAGPDDYYHGGGSFHGPMQDVAVYDHALDATRIAAHYAASK